MRTLAPLAAALAVLAVGACDRQTPATGDKVSVPAGTPLPMTTPPPAVPAENPPVTNPTPAPPTPAPAIPPAN